MKVLWKSVYKQYRRTQGHSDKDEIQEDAPHVEDDRSRSNNNSSFQLCNSNGSSFLTPKREKLLLVDGGEDKYLVLAQFGILKESLYEFLKCPYELGT